MAIASTRRIVNEFTSAVDIENMYSAVEASSSDSPAQVSPVALSAGANTIDVPTGATGVTIIMPAGNLLAITLKGTSGDDGIVLALTDPTSIGLNSSVTSFVLDAEDDVTIRLIWS